MNNGAALLLVIILSGAALPSTCQRVSIPAEDTLTSELFEEAGPAGGSSTNVRSTPPKACPLDLSV